MSGMVVAPSRANVRRLGVRFSSFVPLTPQLMCLLSSYQMSPDGAM